MTINERINWIADWIDWTFYCVLHFRECPWLEYFESCERVCTMLLNARRRLSSEE